MTGLAGPVSVRTQVVRFTIPARQGAIPARLEVNSPLGAPWVLSLYVDDELV